MIGSLKQMGIMLFLTLRADISFEGLDEYAIRKKEIESKTTDLNTKTSETVDDEDDVSEVQTVSPVKTNETQTVKTRVDKIGQTSQKQGFKFKNHAMNEFYAKKGIKREFSMARTPQQNGVA
ncbi:putative ribonuclease H-like domain-containing protein [Tanacetum coccineum]